MNGKQKGEFFELEKKIYAHCKILSIEVHLLLAHTQ